MIIAGSVAFVTGGAQGIGQAICRALLTKGARVCVADFNAEKGQHTVNEFESEFPNCCLFSKCDVNNAENVKSAIQKTVSHFGKLDIVANNAGVLMEKDFRQCGQTNFIGMMEVFYAALKHMSATNGGNGGVIINTASISGVTNYEFLPAYSASKHAVVSFTRCWGTDLHFNRHKVRTNCICPGIVETELFGNMLEESYDKEFIRKLFSKGKRFSLEEIANGFIQLVEDDNKNGQALVWRKKPGIPPIYESENSHL